MKLTLVKLHRAFFALLACPLLWACQAEDVPLDAPIGSLHTVQLGFSLSADENVTRMSAAEMGIGLSDDQKGLLRSVTFIPYSTSGAIGTEDVPLGENIVYGSNAGEKTLYNGVQLPLGTQSFLVYGQHLQIGAVDEGRLATTFGKPAKNIMISPVSYMPSGTDAYNAFKAKGQKLLDYLTSIANTTYFVNGATKAWRETDNEEMLNLYKEFISLKSGGDLNSEDPPVLAVASSSANVLAMVQDFYDQLKDNKDDISKSICENITTYKGKSLLNEGQISFSMSGSPLPDDFPTSDGLPSGSAACKWDNASKQFIDQAVTVSQLQIAPSECYAYPAALWYRTNSTILTSTTSERDLYVTMGADGKETSTNLTWEQVQQGYAQGTGAVVTTQTQSVAVKDQLQYAVAQFEVKVHAVDNTLKDNDGNDIQIKDKDTFPLTGILVGGQRAVDYQFHQYSLDHYSTLTSPNFTVYDRNVSGLSLQKDNGADASIRTLLLESQPTYKADGNFIPITFALEFQNDSGADFIGVDKKIIAPGCKFYLVGDILPADKGDGTLTFKEGDLVFKQDCLTSIDVTVNSLKNAYYIIPDLRDPQLKVGLTVADWIMSTPSGSQSDPIVM